VMGQNGDVKIGTSSDIWQRFLTLVQRKSTENHRAILRSFAILLNFRAKASVSDWSSGCRGRMSLLDVPSGWAIVA
jgi:hypothetical protein